MLTGRYRKAQHYFERCDQLCQRIDRPDTRAGALFRKAELAKLQGKKKEAEELAEKAKKIAEKDIPSLQKRAQNFQSQMQGDRKEQFNAVFDKIRMVVTLSIDLLFNAPLQDEQQEQFEAVSDKIKAVSDKIKMVVTLSSDLLFNAPLVLLQSIGYYTLFLGAKLTAKMRR
jgi:tetratricopeptide (TPR) repeat protein